MPNELKYTSVFQEMSFGDYGFRVLSSGETSIENEYFSSIQVLTDTIVSFDNETIKGDNEVVGMGIMAGQIIYGNFTNISVTSGKIIAYLR